MAASAQGPFKTKWQHTNTPGVTKVISTGGERWGTGSRSEPSDTPVLLEEGRDTQPWTLLSPDMVKC